MLYSNENNIMHDLNKQKKVIIKRIMSKMYHGFEKNMKKNTDNKKCEQQIN